MKYLVMMMKEGIGNKKTILDIETRGEKKNNEVQKRQSA